MGKPHVYKVGDVVVFEIGPAMVTQVWPTGNVSLTLFPPNSHPVYLTLKEEDLR